MLDRFKSREAAEVGTALADEIVPPTDPASGHGAVLTASPAQWEQLLRPAVRKVHALQLNVYKKAKFANSFKWRLNENGLAQETVDALTQSLVLHLAAQPADSSQLQKPAIAGAEPGRPKQLCDLGNKAFARALTRPKDASRTRSRSIPI